MLLGVLLLLPWLDNCSLLDKSKQWSAGLSCLGEITSMPFLRSLVHSWCDTSDLTNGWAGLYRSIQALCPSVGQFYSRITAISALCSFIWAKAIWRGLWDERNSCGVVCFGLFCLFICLFPYSLGSPGHQWNGASLYWGYFPYVTCENPTFQPGDAGVRLCSLMKSFALNAATLTFQTLE